MQSIPNDIQLQIQLIGYILAAAGSLILFIGVLLSHIYFLHRRESSKSFNSIRLEIEKIDKENREDHIRIFDKIEKIKRGKDEQGN